MISGIRTTSCSVEEARLRLRAARAYLEAARLALADDREEFASVAAGNAVLAGIAAADALCCKGLGSRARSQDHRQAAELVKTASTKGPRHKTLLLRLLDLKDESHYGFLNISAGAASRAVKSAGELVDGAVDSLHR